MTLADAHLRIARPTDRMDAVVAFYRDGLGFEVLGSFADHDGFDGVMLGHADAPYHLELTAKRGHEAGDAPTEEHLLVFYVPAKSTWDEAVARMREAGYDPVAPCNPYWADRGETFADPDGYRVVLQNDAWP